MWYWHKYNMKLLKIPLQLNKVGKNFCLILKILVPLESLLIIYKGNRNIFFQVSFNIFDASCRHCPSWARTEWIFLLALIAHLSETSRSWETRKKNLQNNKNKCDSKRKERKKKVMTASCWKTKYTVDVLDNLRKVGFFILFWCFKSEFSFS